MGDRIPLACAARHVRLRELTGADERAVDDTSAAATVRLLDRLLHADDGGEPVTAAQLAAADRDRLLLAAHRRAFGDRVEAMLTCRACGAPFDLDFTLTALTEFLPGDAPAAAVERVGAGLLEAPGIGRFRLPTGADEIAVAGLGAQAGAAALLERCAVEPDPAFEPAALEALLDGLAPLVDLDVDAACPDCGTSAAVHFDIQSWFLGALLADRQRLLADVHRLASAYRWTAAEVLALGRSERQALVRLVDLDAARAWGIR